MGWQRTGCAGGSTSAGAGAEGEEDSGSGDSAAPSPLQLLCRVDCVSPDQRTEPGSRRAKNHCRQDLIQLIGRQILDLVVPFAEVFVLVLGIEGGPDQVIPQLLGLGRGADIRIESYEPFLPVPVLDHLQQYESMKSGAFR